MHISSRTPHIISMVQNNTIVIRQKIEIESNLENIYLLIKPKFKQKFLKKTKTIKQKYECTFKCPIT